MLPIIVGLVLIGTFNGPKVRFLFVVIMRGKISGAQINWPVMKLLYLKQFNKKLKRTIFPSLTELALNMSSDAPFINQITIR